MTSSAPPGLARFNAVDDPDAAATLRTVCASRTWGAALAGGRPYATVGELLDASDAAMTGLTAADLAEAMAAHPPIGRPAPGDAASAREQNGVRDAERAELLELNLAYQERHGHVFLICATGRTGEEMLAALRERIHHDADTEREIVRTELGKINRIRLTRLVETLSGPAGPGGRRAAMASGATSVSTHILDTSIGRPAVGVVVELAVRSGPGAEWTAHADSLTDADGRCTDLPALPEGTTHARLRFETGPYLTHAFFPEVAVAFAVEPGEHYHVPLLLTPFGYSVYRGS
ncbi:2-oxo-4-hydroxy-4-carboxy-5-ureidoimidazoline decarboxylase [Streptomyces malaysiensis]|uniref:2-oxo-4-hydroxy-4-carboxy-5-ureidoimidazoline decarboxylase n=1 Tax=Streptomyces malaysiensis subsp. samsunensis TaxID=459658 RepID=A0A9X2LZQ3_STRMQ|nr:2-oxo-4-hydroxy-4-carboxy-5-ureidoimidazoline decarboxylase [Streptomyces samsunensis]MCQ8832463.1 2-oxo-4-hydroxy-4-carboxy-5-ureidoimidazoline decarboxylase [Streptomyces samsunensis]